MNPQWTKYLLLILVVLVIGDGIWTWEIERVVVPPGHCLVLIHRWGRELPADELIAPDDSYKGVYYDVKTPGTHFINPIFYSYEMYPQGGIL